MKVNFSKYYKLTFLLLQISIGIASTILLILSLATLFDKNILAELKMYYSLIYLLACLGTLVTGTITTSILLRFVFKEDINIINPKKIKNVKYQSTTNLNNNNTEEKETTNKKPLDPTLIVAIALLSASAIGIIIIIALLI